MKGLMEIQHNFADNIALTNCYDIMDKIHEDLRLLRFWFD